MSKEKLTIKLIDMYCNLARSLFSDKYTQADANDRVATAEFNKKLDKKYGINVINEEMQVEIAKANKIQKRISELEQERRCIYNQPDYIKDKENHNCRQNYQKVNEDLQNVIIAIKLSSCPEEIKKIFKKIK